MIMLRHTRPFSYKNKNYSPRLILKKELTFNIFLNLLNKLKLSTEDIKCEFGLDQDFCDYSVNWYLKTNDKLNIYSYEALCETIFYKEDNGVPVLSLPSHD